MKVLVLMLALSPTAVLAADKGSADWANQVIKATGQGAPDLHAASPASARIGAERAAKIDALRNILAQVKGLSLSSGQTVGDRMAGNADLSARVEGVVRGFRIVGQPRYFDDGGVEIDVEVPMSGVLTELAADEVGSKVADLPATGTPSHSGLVIDAKSLKVQPALEPRILDETGKPVFSAAVINQDWLKKQGVAGWLRDVDEAKKNPRVGDKPLVFKALKAAGSDVVISNKDADLLRDPKGNVQFLSEGRVIIVTD